MSTVLTWIGTPGAAPFVEANHKKRKPTPRFASVKTLETHISSLARDGVRTHVLGSGILYGNGEADLHAMFRVCVACALAFYASVYLCMCSEYPWIQYWPCIFHNALCRVRWRVRWHVLWLFMRQPCFCPRDTIRIFYCVFLRLCCCVVVCAWDDRAFTGCVDV